ncbi:phosphotransferase family protein [Saccharothrix violaceirubra]|uniref:Aminoglycoside phosphotransferase (APT) family kinase protein n=1 Tax=Saccharothrix violaceirubra TaxID=413306 RepID=A0A7W7SXV2_9PSEU|nr:phosphotransferase [Saccharothrix violaceirubra]MBB4962873.1 aminoglycoside phosphotransferase (APT) family kinase protein [Saccharothrix violaceirubra]
MDDLVAGMVALAAGGAHEVLAVRGPVVVVRVGDVVLKAHEPGTDLDALTLRLAVAERLGRVLLPPLGPPVVVGDRVVTSWPYGRPVPQGEPESLPMEVAGRLLAELHRVPAPAGSPEATAWARMVRAVRDMPTHVDGAALVERAFATLPERGPSGSTLVHGDWHLGQLLWRDGWWLIDLDDLGFGDPAWDLARPAALLLAGVLDDVTWARLLDAYLDAGGTAVRRDDPWAALEVPARALVIQMAARALTAAERDGKRLESAQSALMDACARIVSTHVPMARG